MKKITEHFKMILIVVACVVFGGSLFGLFVGSGGSFGSSSAIDYEEAESGVTTAAATADVIAPDTGKASIVVGSPVALTDGIYLSQVNASDTWTDVAERQSTSRGVTAGSSDDNFAKQSGVATTHWSYITETRNGTRAIRAYLSYQIIFDGAIKAAILNDRVSTIAIQVYFRAFSLLDKTSTVGSASASTSHEWKFALTNDIPVGNAAYQSSNTVNSSDTAVYSKTLVITDGASVGGDQYLSLAELRGMSTMSAMFIMRVDNSITATNVFGNPTYNIRASAQVEKVNVSYTYKANRTTVTYDTATTGGTDGGTIDKETATTPTTVKAGDLLAAATDYKAKVETVTDNYRFTGWTGTYYSATGVSVAVSGGDRTKSPDIPFWNCFEDRAIIVTANFTLITAPTSTDLAGPYTYNTTAQGPTMPVIAAAVQTSPVTTITTKYKGRDSTTYAESETKPTNAGNYTITAKYYIESVEVGNYTGANFSIAKASITRPATGFNSFSYTYGDITAANPLIQTISTFRAAVDTNDKTTNISVNIVWQNINKEHPYVSDTGTKTLTITPTGTFATNYNATELTVYLTILPKEITVAPKTYTFTKAYDGNTIANNIANYANIGTSFDASGLVYGELIGNVFSQNLDNLVFDSPNAYYASNKVTYTIALPTTDSNYKIVYGDTTPTGCTPLIYQYKFTGVINKVSLSVSGKTPTINKDYDGLNTVIGSAAITKTQYNSDYLTITGYVNGEDFAVVTAAFGSVSFVYTGTDVTTTTATLRISFTGDVNYTLGVTELKDISFAASINKIDLYGVTGGQIVYGATKPTAGAAATGISVSGGAAQSFGGTLSWSVDGNALNSVTYPTIAQSGAYTVTFTPDTGVGKNYLTANKNYTLTVTAATLNLIKGAPALTKAYDATTIVTNIGGLTGYDLVAQFGSFLTATGLAGNESVLTAIFNPLSIEFLDKNVNIVGGAVAAQDVKLYLSVESTLLANYVFAESSATYAYDEAAQKYYILFAGRINPIAFDRIDNITIDFGTARPTTVTAYGKPAGLAEDEKMELEVRGWVHAYLETAAYPNAGVYDDALVLVGSNNYIEATKGIVLTVNQIGVQTVTAITMTYGELLPNAMPAYAVVSAGKFTILGTVSYLGSGVENLTYLGVGASPYALSVSFTPNDVATGNFKVTTVIFNVTVRPKKVEIELDEITVSAVYDGKSQIELLAARISGGINDGFDLAKAVYISRIEDGTKIVKSDNVINAYNYTVTFALSADAVNYTAVSVKGYINITPIAADFTIERKSGQIIVSNPLKLNAEYSLDGVGWQADTILAAKDYEDYDVKIRLKGDDAVNYYLTKAAVDGTTKYYTTKTIESKASQGKWVLPVIIAGGAALFLGLLFLLIILLKRKKDKEEEEEQRKGVRSYRAELVGSPQQVYAPNNVRR
ncbi:MAG: hypothetical protein LBT20_01510 [Clostridiales bacterium]|jgi:hypothetical protein|nr:hypothetical protein [Clostridiales bacterium]